MSYDHRPIEAKWRTWWNDNDTFRVTTDPSKPKYYVLDMFPYPSGSGLHVGHPKGYVASDIVARARRMMGFNVLRVMGWDSFGLPAERQAEKEDKHPREITTRNIATFKSQLSQLGLSYDWSRELATSDPSYYKWTQWIFLKLYERGLAYQAEVPVNWCPALGTVLANEEVVDGRYVETGDPVERRSMKQWMFKITEYAESLLAGLETLDWPEGIKAMQRDWIGRSEGARFSFEVADTAGPDGTPRTFEVFTTRPDTLFGCTYAVLSPEHALVADITTDAQRGDVEAYVKAAGKKSERDRISQAVDAPKTGAFTGAYAKHPVTGEPVPIWIADYVLAHYGTGAVFACPAHDERDHAFAKSFGLPIVEVVQGGADVQAEPYIGDGPHVASQFLDGMKQAEAITAIVAWLSERGIGEGTVQYRLRDWLFSRQRYWGEPFPLIELADGTVKPLPEDALPVLLPEIEAYKPTADGKPPLARAEDWVATTDPETGAPARRETNTMPQWAGSCWYYLRFISPTRDDVAWDADEERYWMPVDLYIGGAEHAVLHLLYARFWHHVLHDLGLVSTREPFQRLFNQGMVHAMSYREVLDADPDGNHVPASQVTVDGETATRTADGVALSSHKGRWHYPTDVEERGGSWFVKGKDIRLAVQLEKMSKSRSNVENPDDVCESHGADALRLYEVFMGPLDAGAQWETSGVAGTKRFLDRAYRLVSGDVVSVVDGTADDAEVDRALHAAIAKVTDAVESLRFNTAISEMMIFVNVASKAKAIGKEQLDLFVRIVSPFAPHLGEEMWRILGHDGTIADAPWPKADASKLALDTIKLVVQVNGKLRSHVELPKDAAKDTILEAARSDPKVAKYFEGKTVAREIVVPGRLVNFVVR
ncbi:MAG: leucine--tRNA ligase [Myxococcota bacterium]